MLDWDVLSTAATSCNEWEIERRRSSLGNIHMFGQRAFQILQLLSVSQPILMPHDLSVLVAVPTGPSTPPSQKRGSSPKALLGKYRT